LKQLAAEVQQLKDELVEAGAWPLDEEELNNVAGGYSGQGWRPPTFRNDPIPEDSLIIPSDF